MQRRLTREEKNNLLITRTTRLKVFADKLGSNARYLIEQEAYLVLEVFEPAPRAILRYAGKRFRRWLASQWFSIRFRTLVWYHRRIKGIGQWPCRDLCP